MTYHYVWLVWSVAFLLPWSIIFLANTKHRTVMWRTSAVTALLGLTEPIFVPAYWNPPSLFELARFSDRALGAAQHDRALDALDDIKAAIDEGRRDAVAP